MELASKSRIALAGCKPEINCQRVSINHSGFNSRYQLILEGISQQALSYQAFDKMVSIQLFQHAHTSYFHGGLRALEQHPIKNELWSWRLELGCSLQRLSNEASGHLFVDKTVEEIIKRLFIESGIACLYDIKSPLNTLAYTAQGGVSDYDFLLRLCAEHGLIFYYRHHEHGVSLIITDQPECLTTHQLAFNPANGLLDGQPVITRLTSHQTSLPDHVRLRAYNEEDFTTIWETKTQNTTTIAGRGVINLMESHSLINQKQCDLKANLLQQQLDWQRETFYIESCGTDLQVGDGVCLTNSEDMDASFMVVDLRGSVDESPQKGEPHPYLQKAYLLPLARVYKQPCKETLASWCLFEEKDYVPEGWKAGYKKPQPALQMALISGEKNAEISIDQQGRYKVKPFFDTQHRITGHSSHYLRQLQPGAGVGSNKAQGVHLPLAVNTRVVLAHLDHQIDKPFILGVHPGFEQRSPVNRANATMLSLRHRTGSALEFNEISYKQQSVHLSTQENQHGLTLKIDQEKESITGLSQGEMHLLAEKDLRISSQETQLHNDSFLFKAEETFSFAVKEKMTMHSGNKLQFNSGSDWQSLTKSGELNCQAEKDIQITGKNIALNSTRIDGKSARANAHAGHTFSFKGANSLSLEAGESAAVFTNKRIGFKARQIILSADNVQKNQSGMANSGFATLPKIDNTLIQHASTVNDLVTLGYESLKKKEVHNNLSRAGSLHKDKTRKMTIAKNLKKAQSTFKTPSSKSYQILDKAINSRTYTYLNKAGKTLSVLYVGTESYNAYVSNAKMQSNILWREVLSSTVGASTEVITGSMYTATWARGGFVMGELIFAAGGGFAGAAVGAAAGVISYNYTFISNKIKETSSSWTRTMYNFITNHLYWR